MFRRSFLELSSRRSLIRRVPRVIASQRIPSVCSSRKHFSTASQQNASPKSGHGGKPPSQPKSNLPKVLLWSAVVGGVALLAYQSGYLEQYIGKEEQGLHSAAKIDVFHKDEEETNKMSEEETNKVSHEVDQSAEKAGGQANLPRFEVDKKAETHIDLPDAEVKPEAESHVDLPHTETEQKTDTKTDLPHVDDEHLKTSGQMPTEDQSHIQEESNVTTEQGTIGITDSQKDPVTETPESKASGGLNAGIHATEVQTQAKVASEENELKTVPSVYITREDKSEAALGKSSEAGLLDTYHLKEKEESTASTGLGEQAFAGAMEELNDGYITKEGKLVLDFLQAIHEAEKRQAELDRRAFSEEKRALKEKYEKELRDLRARELMRTEEAAMLDKEMKRERAKAAAAIRTIQEKMEDKLRMELEQKENETEMKLKQLEELAKAELAAAITKEKAAQIEKMAEANLHINALCMAFYARSEEARQIQSVHKLALGALALEDALSRGLPIQKELDAVNTYLEGIDKDSLLHLVLSTLPEETRHHGTDTLLQLNQKFNSLKGILRHHILIPPGGGGILAHGLAQIASWLRIKQVDPSGDGIESIISRVERFLAEGKLAEAAEALQDGVRGSKAEEMVGDWVERARNRAITEQALTVLQSYATSISLTQ